jgi:hypothetical protein
MVPWLSVISLTPLPLYPPARIPRYPLARRPFCNIPWMGDQANDVSIVLLERSAIATAAAAPRTEPRTPEFEVQCVL